VLWDEKTYHHSYADNEYITIINVDKGIRDDCVYSSECATVLKDGVIYEMKKGYFTTDFFERV
jgi:hypothetical protein